MILYFVAESVCAMGFENIWCSHPKKYGQGSRRWYVLFFTRLEAASDFFVRLLPFCDCMVNIEYLAVI